MTIHVTMDQLKYEAWRRGLLDYKLHEGQRYLTKVIREQKKQLFVANIARQWGKSFWATTTAIAEAIKKPKARIKYGTAFQTDLVEFIMPTFDLVLEDCPDHMRPRYKVQGSKWIFPNGSEIALVGIDRKPNGLRGNKVDMIILDECGFIDKLKYLYTSVIIPATTHRPECKVIMISTPPSTPAHSFVDFIQKAELEGTYVKRDIYTNPLIGEDTIERLADEMGGKDSSTFKREALCELITDEDLAIIPEWREDYIAEDTRDIYHPFYHKYVSMDLGVKDQTAAIFGHYDYLRATLVIEDEFVMSGSSLTTLKIRDAVKSKESELWKETPPYMRISDNNNPLLLQDLSHLHGIHFNATDKGSLEEMINQLKIMVSRGQIRIHPRCVQLIGCMKYGVWDAKRTKFARSQTYGHFDALAALIYLVHNLNKVTNPIPQTFQVDLGNAIIFPRRNKSEGAEALRQSLTLKGLK